MFSISDVEARCYERHQDASQQQQNLKVSQKYYQKSNNTHSRDARHGKKQLVSTVHDYDNVKMDQAHEQLVMHQVQTYIERHKNHNAKGYALNDPKITKLIQDHLEKSLRVVWKQIMASFFMVYDAPSEISTHSNECSVQCFLAGTMMILDQDLLICACRRHGHVHRCLGDVSHCPVIYVGADLGRTCCFSRRFLGYISGDDSSYKVNRSSQGLGRGHYVKSMRAMEKARDSIADKNTESRVQGVLASHQSAAAAAAAAPTTAANAQEDEEDSRASHYNSMVEAAVLDSTIDTSTAGATTSHGYKGVVARLVSKQEDEEKQDERRHKKAADRLRREANLINSTAVVRLSNQALRTARVSMRSVVHEVADDIFFNVENRNLYNTFKRGCYAQEARAEVRSLYQLTCVMRRVPCLSDIVDIFDSHNNRYHELVAKVDRDADFVEHYIKRVMWLWELCMKSPHVIEKQLSLASANKARDSAIASSSNSDRQSRTITPLTDGMCSLRQLALATLYYMRDGLSVHLKFQTVSVISAEENLTLFLPSSHDVHYFGEYALAELKQHISCQNLVESSFDATRLLRDDVSIVNDDGSVKRGRNSGGGGGGGGGGSRHGAGDLAIQGGNVRKKRQKFSTTPLLKSSSSSAIIRSNSIEMSLSKSRKERNRHKRSKAQSEFAEITDNERNGYMRHGKVKLDNGRGGAVSERQLTPFHMREPMLTGGAKFTMRHLYHENDIHRARRFVTLSLSSYQNHLSTILVDKFH